MARIIGGIATSHSPTIGFALDRQKQDDPVWAPIFEAYQPVRQWLAEKKPDVLFLIYNDHVTSFSSSTTIRISRSGLANRTRLRTRGEALERCLP